MSGHRIALISLQQETYFRPPKRRETAKALTFYACPILAPAMVDLRIEARPGARNFDVARLS